MAIIQCAECNGEVSTKASGCPKCGAPLKSTENPISGGALEALGFLLIVGGMITAMATSGTVDTVAKVSAFIGLVVFLSGRFKRN